MANFTLLSNWNSLVTSMNFMTAQLALSSFLVGVLLFKCLSAACAPYCRYEVEQVFGFVEELKVKKDPEYHWVDNFRASRISNEERQLLLRNLSG